MLEYFNDMAIFRNICNQKTLLDGVVFIGSFALTIWFTSIQFDRYGRNQDQSLISYHDIIFDSKSKDQPPTYTLCIDNDNLIDEYISNSNNVFKQHSPAWIPNVTSPEVYYEYLSGGLPTDSDIYERFFANITFEEVAFDLKKDFMIHFFSQKQRISSRTFYWESYDENLMKIKFPKVHQNLREICYSREFSSEAGSKVVYDVMKFNASKLIETEVSLKVYLHQRGQFIRHVSFEIDPYLTNLNPHEMKKMFKDSKIDKTFHEIRFDVKGISVLRKRENAVNPCNGSLLNEDKKWRDHVIESVGCIPEYWRIFYTNLSEQKHIKSCNPKQYESKFGSRSYLRETLKIFTSRYKTPCTEVRKSVSSNTFTTGDPDEDFVGIRFAYRDSKYMEIMNVKDYTGETLLSQVGGFIGK